MQYHMRVAASYVLDTGVLVAALRSDQGASRQILLDALKRKFVWLVSVPLMLEYEAVLSRPEHLAAAGIGREELGSVLSDIASVAKPVRLAFRWRPYLPDPGDDMVLETAVNGDANAIVTFNLRHFGTAEHGFQIPAIAPATALKTIRSGPYETK